MDIVQSKSDLEQQLEEQLQLLKSLSGLYDKGDIVVAKSIATCVRVLLYNTNNSHALLFQIDKQGIKFFDTNGAEHEMINKENGKRIGNYSGIVGAGVGKNKYIPYLDEPIPGHAKYVSLSEYWNRVILVDGQGNSFTRSDIVLAVSNKDGGAHVDPSLDEKYIKLSRKNSMGFRSGMGNDLKKFEGVELAVIRQIGHELIRTLDPDSPQQKMKTDGSVGVMGSNFVITKH
jgi:hypothetical protein